MRPSILGTLSSLLLLAPATLALPRVQQAARTDGPGARRTAWYERTHGLEHLPRFEPGRERAEPVVFEPFAVDLRAARESGAGDGPQLPGVLDSPPEYGPTEGVMFRWGAGWNSVVNDCVAGLTGDPTKDELAYVVVTNTNQRNSAQTAFANAGADLSKVVFLIEPSDSIWLRDYGPHFIWQGGARAIVDSHYYPSRPRDNYIPTRVARDEFQEPAYPMGLYYSGGNFQPGPNRSGFITSLVFEDNPDFTAEEVAELYQRYQGIDTLHIFPALPGSVDGTGHIDMWMYIVDEDDVIISEFKPGSNASAIEITENAVPYMESLGFTVWRTPAWNAGFTHYTYSNAFRVNDRIFAIKYRDGNAAYADEDAQALTAFQNAAGPGVEILPIDCYSIISASGAIHCIVMQVPRYQDPVPSAHVVAPAGGEMLVPGDAVELLWSAIDDTAVTSVDLAYSTDGGLSYPHTIASGLPNTGSHPWTVPTLRTDRARLRVTASDAGANAGVGTSADSFRIANHASTVYDFGTGAGVDRWVWGSSTSSWSAQVAGNRYPVTTELGAADYAALATSNATGGDNDANRYRAPSPSGGRETAHVFEFTLAEERHRIVDLELLWEGYGDQCLQMELYVFDLLAQDWGDGAGNTGENAYMANFAGNEDEELVGHLQRNLERYVDGAGRITFLLYGERPNQDSFHDYARVRVVHRGEPRVANPPESRGGVTR